MLEEIWKEIPNYNGAYLISNYGRVYSKHKKGYLAQTTNNNGYLKVSLWKDNKGKNEYVHRLVALAFIPNPEGFPQVNHMDEDKQNNYVENLEWCDNSYNNTYGTKRQRQGETLLNNGKTSYRVNQYDLDGNFIATYRSMREAERINHLGNGAISACLRKGYKQWGGYRWEKVV